MTSVYAIVEWADAVELRPSPGGRWGSRRRQRVGHDQRLRHCRVGDAVESSTFPGRTLGFAPSPNESAMTRVCALPMGDRGRGFRASRPTPAWPSSRTHGAQIDRHADLPSGRRVFRGDRGGSESASAWGRLIMTSANSRPRAKRPRGQFVEALLRVRPDSVAVVRRLAVLLALTRRAHPALQLRRRHRPAHERGPAHQRGGSKLRSSTNRLRASGAVTRWACQNIAAVPSVNPPFVHGPLCGPRERRLVSFA